MVRVSGKIGRLLIDAGLVSADDFTSARETGRPVVDVLLERGTVEEERLFEILGLTSGLPPVDLTRIKPDPQAVEALPQEMCTEHCVLPIARNGDNLTVAISDPFDVLLLDDLNLHSHCRVRPVLSYPAAIRRAQAQRPLVAYECGIGAPGAAQGRAEVHPRARVLRMSVEVALVEQDRALDVARAMPLDRAYPGGLRSP